MTSSLQLLAGPFVIEIRDCAEGALAGVCWRLGVEYIFKAGFDKANRLSGNSFRGPVPDEGLAILAVVRERFGVPVLTDIHESQQAAAAAQSVDVLQIPAFHCRSRPTCWRLLQKPLPASPRW